MSLFHIRFTRQRDCDTAVMSHPASSRQKNLENENTGRQKTILSFASLSGLQNVKSSQSAKSQKPTVVSYNLWCCSESATVSASCSFEGHQNGPAGGTRFQQRESLFCSGRFRLDSLLVRTGVLAYYVTTVNSHDIGCLAKCTVNARFS